MIRLAATCYLALKAFQHLPPLAALLLSGAMAFALLRS